METCDYCSNEVMFVGITHVSDVGAVARMVFVCAAHRSIASSEESQRDYFWAFCPSYEAGKARLLGLRDEYQFGIAG